MVGKTFTINNKCFLFVCFSFLIEGIHFTCMSDVRDSDRRYFGNHPVLYNIKLFTTDKSIYYLRRRRIRIQTYVVNTMMAIEACWTNLLLSGLMVCTWSCREKCSLQSILWDWKGEKLLWIRRNKGFLIETGITSINFRICFNIHPSVNLEHTATS